MPDLNPKQEQFCHEYIKDSNGTQAAIRAGYSTRTAQEQSSRLLLNAMVQRRIAELRKPIEEKCELTAEWILRRLMDEAQNHERGNARVKALELLARTKGMLIDRVIQETKPLYDGSAYDDLLQTETVESHAVRQDGQQGPLPLPPAHRLPRAGLTELPQVNGAGPAAD